jgi:hypothetical protein
MKRLHGEHDFARQDRIAGDGVWSRSGLPADIHQTDLPTSRTEEARTGSRMWRMPEHPSPCASTQDLHESPEKMKASCPQQHSDQRANVEGNQMPNAVSESHRNLALQFKTGSEDRLIARRNTLVGLWAGAQLGLPEESRAIYALEVMAHGMTDSGHDDVVDKIIRDFAKQGIPITRGQILVQLSKSHHRVTTQRVATD